jgi:hypothetical protein
VSTAATPTAYREHAPPPALRPFVDCFWTRGDEPAAVAVGTHRVLPDGCVDVLLTATGDTTRAVVVGTMTTAALVPASPGTRFVAARLRPGAARRLLGVAAHALTDRDVDVRELWAGADALHAAATAPDALARLTSALLARAFAEHVGVSPKQLARVVLDLGYHDQAHLTREPCAR